MVAQAESPRTASGQDGGAPRLYLTCVLAGSRYLIPASAVREVEEVGAITPVPATRAWLRGVMNLRGMIVGVVDLAQFLGLVSDQALGTEALICNTRDDGREGDDDLLIALAVEAVSNIRTLGADDLMPVPDHAQADAIGAYLSGLYRAPAAAGRPEELLGVLDLEALLRALVADQLAAPASRG